MPKLVVVITPHPEKWFDIAKAWEEAGAPGVTILDAHGLYTLHKQTRLEIQSPLLSIGSILRQMEENCRIIFSIAPEELVDRLFQRTLDIIDLNAPHTGVGFVLDVERTVGIGPAPNK